MSTWRRGDAGGSDGGPRAEQSSRSIRTRNFPLARRASRRTIAAPAGLVADRPAGPERARSMRRLGVSIARCIVPLLREGESHRRARVRGKAGPILRAERNRSCQTFADQAVIAIENARLFDETQEALEQQKATADVLQVISRSTFDLDSVFRHPGRNAVRLCGARTGMIFQRDGEMMRLAAADGATAEFVSYVHEHPIAPGRGTVTGRVGAGTAHRPYSRSRERSGIYLRRPIARAATGRSSACH